MFIHITHPTLRLLDVGYEVSFAITLLLHRPVHPFFELPPAQDDLAPTLSDHCVQQMLCGRDGCTMPAWHAGMCMPALEEEEEEGSVRRSRRALAPPRPPSLLSGPEVNKTSREVERQQRRGGVVNKAEEKPAGLRLVTSRLARSGEILISLDQLLNRGGVRGGIESKKGGRWRRGGGR